MRVPIVTLGEKDAFLSGTGLISAVSCGPVFETTRACDALDGAFAAALSTERSLENAVHSGCETTGVSVTRGGTAPSTPFRSLVEEQLARLA